MATVSYFSLLINTASQAQWVRLSTSPRIAIMTAIVPAATSSPCGLILIRYHHPPPQKPIFCFGLQFFKPLVSFFSLQFSMLAAVTGISASLTFVAPGTTIPSATAVFACTMPAPSLTLRSCGDGEWSDVRWTVR